MDILKTCLDLQDLYGPSFSNTSSRSQAHQDVLSHSVAIEISQGRKQNSSALATGDPNVVNSQAQKSQGAQNEGLYGGNTVLIGDLCPMSFLICQSW